MFAPFAVTSPSGAVTPSRVIAMRSRRWSTVPDLFSPEAAAVDREILSVSERDRSYWPTVALRRLDGSVVPLPLPMEDQLLRHAERFGLEGVEQTAAMFGVTLPAKASRRPVTKSAAPRRRRTSPELVTEVLALRERGMREPVIAETLNVSERRVRQILSAAA